jgi:hypothetical protein
MAHQSFLLFHLIAVGLAALELTSKLLLSNLNQLTRNVTPDAARVSCQNITVVTVLGKGNAKGLCDLVFHLIQRLVRLGNHQVIALGHALHLLAVGNRILSFCKGFM